MDVVTPDPIGPPGPGPNPPGTCTETAPTGLTATKTSLTSAVLNWTPGINGGYQALWVSTNSDPQLGCAGSLGGTSVCPVRLDSGTSPLPENTNTYTLDNLLTPGVVYYWVVMNVQTASCYYSTWNFFPCELTPSPLTMGQWQSRTLSSTISSDFGIGGVIFHTNNISADPSSDISYPYQTLLTANSQGSASVDAEILATDLSLICRANVVVTVLPPSPWWQVKDSDIQSAGDLVSSVPEISGNRFNLAGPGGFPGVSGYAGYTNLRADTVSSTGWLVESTLTNQRAFDYAYFVNQIPADIAAVVNSVDTADVPASLSSGDSTHDVNDYYWYKYDGAINGNQALTIPATDIGTRKVILMVDNANVNITGNINLTDGQGFFMLIVRGNINVDPAVVGGVTPNLEGLYLADGTFSDGFGNTQFWVRGSVAGNLGVNMQRDRGGSANSDPSEFFEYAPDQMMLYPKVLGVRKINWKEVAP